MSFDFLYACEAAERQEAVSQWAPLTNLLEAEASGASALDLATLVLPPVPVGRSSVRPRSGRRGSERWSAPEAAFSSLRSTDSRHVIVLSSARAQGLSFRNPGFATEGVDRATKDPEARSWRAFEKAVKSACSTNPNPPALTILRCAALPDLPDAVGRLFRGNSLVTWLGFDPPIQLLSTGVLAEVVRRIAAAGPTSAERSFYVAPDDAERVSHICRTLGLRRFGVPSFVHRLVTPWSSFSLEERRFLQRPWTASNSSLRKELGVDSLGKTLDVAGSSQKPGREETSTRDSFGLDSKIIERFRSLFLEPARRWYWRVESRGEQGIPRSGPALLVGIHRGYIPLDAMMFLHLARASSGRIVRFLIHPALVRLPWLSIFLPGIGGLLASRENAERVLREGGVLGVFPEGAGSAMIETRNAYPLRPFLSADFARWSIAHRVPVIPVAAIGPAEALPIFKRVNWRWWRKVSGWPTLPIGFLFPFGPPIPLPSRWHILFLEPITIEELDGSSDAKKAEELEKLVRERINVALGEMLDRRKSVWTGSVFRAD